MVQLEQELGWSNNNAVDWGEHAEATNPTLVFQPAASNSATDNPNESVDVLADNHQDQQSTIGTMLRATRQGRFSNDVEVREFCKGTRLSETLPSCCSDNESDWEDINDSVDRALAEDSPVASPQNSHISLHAAGDQDHSEQVACATQERPKSQEWRGKSLSKYFENTPWTR